MILTSTHKTMPENPDGEINDLINREESPKRMHEQESAASMEMPRYRCFKEVHALKIREIEFDRTAAEKENRETDGSATITPVDDGYAKFRVDAEYVRKHKPVEGGYYVVYADGYKSFSPAKAFEDGYIRLT